MIKWTMIPALNCPVFQQYKVDLYPALYLLDPEGVIIAKGQELEKEKINAVFEKYIGPI